MVIKVSVQHNGELLPVIILLTLSMVTTLGNPFDAIKSVVCPYRHF